MSSNQEAGHLRQTMPCWPCFLHEIANNDEFVTVAKRAGVPGPVGWAVHVCDFHDNICITCHTTQQICVRIPQTVIDDATDLMKTIAFINHICHKCYPNPTAAPEQGDAPVYLLSRASRQELVHHLLNLAMHFLWDIIGPGPLSELKDQHAGHGTRLTAADDRYLPWQCAIKRFHAGVSSAIQHVNTEIKTLILGGIPIKLVNDIDVDFLAELSDKIDNAVAKSIRNEIGESESKGD
ncbi:hypothetical protein FALBO_11923 [Fusarium albosuccineum]|uniref:Uncharacterized protein n=1 Tax=Fusarium albosuccineum TaxID=1237068 RepID=A0A8H4L2Y3_9HYPO|nr:hypothetical protein FALBO_11923 [Fusarium albosuccineum]